MSWLNRLRKLQRRLLPKAVSDHRPDLASRDHLYSSAAYRADTAAEIDSYVDYAAVYKSYVWVRKAISLIVDAVSPLPVRVVDANGMPLPNHDVSRLLVHGKHLPARSKQGQHLCAVAAAQVNRLPPRGVLSPCVECGGEQGAHGPACRGSVVACPITTRRCLRHGYLQRAP